MSKHAAVNSLPATKLSLPKQRDIYYGGAWHPPLAKRYFETINPATGEGLGNVADGGAADVDAAVKAAHKSFKEWRNVLPLDRAKLLKKIAQVLRDNAYELAMIDSADCGNPVTPMVRDAEFAATQIEFFAGLVTEMKGASIPMGPDRVNFSIREPLGVVARIVPFNHPFMFIAGKIGAPLAAGNTVVMKPPEQASMSSLRLAELIDDILPPGVFNLVPGGRDAGAALASHPLVAKVGLVGSVPTGRAVMRAAADTLKGLLFELGGKNALIAYDDADPDAVAAGVVDGMNFTWCGQSCGSTSRAFIHAEIYDAVLESVKSKVQHYKPGIPTEPATTMGSIINKAQYDKVLAYIQSAKDQGARLINGGSRSAQPELEKGLFVEPTIFADVTPDMRIFREEIFGPVVGIVKWTDEATMIEQVNSVEYGLTASIWTQDLATAHRTAMAVEAGYVWINDVSKHFVGAPFGGYKQSGIGREECMEELLAFTQEKNININLGQHPPMRRML